MLTPINLPEFGASPACLSVWFADIGDVVYEGDRLVEVLVSGATFDVSSSATGRLVKKLVFPREPLQPGQILGLVDVEGQESDEA